ELVQLRLEDLLVVVEAGALIAGPVRDGRAGVGGSSTAAATTACRERGRDERCDKGGDADSSCDHGLPFLDGRSRWVGALSSYLRHKITLVSKRATAIHVTASGRTELRGVPVPVNNLEVCRARSP